MHEHYAVFNSSQSFNSPAKYLLNVLE